MLSIYSTSFSHGRRAFGSQVLLGQDRFGRSFNDFIPTNIGRALKRKGRAFRHLK
jgi:hypothetical protein